MKLNKENYEIWLVDRMDGLLTPEQEAELEAFLKQNPGLQEEADMLELIRLEPDLEIGFPDKASLKKEEGGRVITLFAAGRWAIAAAAVLLAFIGIRFIAQPAESGLAEGYDSATQEATIPYMTASNDEQEQNEIIPQEKRQQDIFRYALDDSQKEEEPQQIYRETQFADAIDPSRLQQLPAQERSARLKSNDFEEQYALINNYDYDKMMNSTNSKPGPETIVDKWNDAVAVANSMSDAFGLGKKEEEVQSGTHYRTRTIRFFGIEYYNRKRINQ